VGFGALAIASAMNAAPLLVAIPVVVAAAFFLLRLRETSHVKGDSAIALISTGALAVGVTVVSMTTGMNTDVYNYLFGSILSMSGSDVWITVLVSLVVLALFVFFYHRIFAVTFDENFTRATGIPAGTYNSLIAILTALVIVIGMRMMGSLLISSLVVFPAMTSMRLCRTFRSVMISAAIVSVVCLMLGLVISYHLGASTGAAISLCLAMIFTISFLFRKKVG
jgi:zinc transport system permease protein